MSPEALPHWATREPISWAPWPWSRPQGPGPKTPSNVSISKEGLNYRQLLKEFYSVIFKFPKHLQITANRTLPRTKFTCGNKVEKTCSLSQVTSCSERIINVWAGKVQHHHSADPHCLLSICRSVISFAPLTLHPCELAGLVLLSPWICRSWKLGTERLQGSLEVTDVSRQSRTQTHVPIVLSSLWSASHLSI